MAEQTPNREVTLREISAETVREICDLSDTLSGLHQHMVAPNAYSIAEAHFSRHAWFRAIYAGETPVGFVMLYIGPEDPPDQEETIYYLWRFMIAGPYHGRGYGRQALEQIIEKVKLMGARDLRLSCEEGEGSPEEFYRRIGFERDGLMYESEIGMRMSFPPLVERPLTHQLLHFSQPERREFWAKIIKQVPLSAGRTGIILDHTYFYPTGGGQEHDLGTLGESKVVDVYKDEEHNQIVHVVDSPLPDGRVRGVIDSERRRRHMQHHTAQHLLSSCFVKLVGLETVSANINGDSPSTLDLEGLQLNADTLQQVETEANRIVCENRPVSTYFVTPERMNRILLRKLPKVSEDIRVVEIAGLDWSACGGTHVSSTGEIGVIKIVRIEKVKEKTRIHFVAGERALELYQVSYEIASGLASELSVGIGEVEGVVRRQIEAGRSARRELERVQSKLLSIEAEQLLRGAVSRSGRQWIFQVFEDRGMNDLRGLGRELLKTPGVVAVLLSVEQDKIAVVIACAEDTGLNAGELIRELMPIISGRGGGDARMAQGGGTANSEQLDALLNAAKSWAG